MLPVETEPLLPPPAPGRFARLRTRLADLLRADSLYTVAPYAGYGTAQRIRLRGRVLQGSPLAPGQADDQLWRNLLSIYTRLESDEVPAAHVRVALAGATAEALTDDEGYYDIWLTPERLAPAAWQQGSVRLLDVETPAGMGVEAPLFEAPLTALVPRAPQFGVISDIDDTILVSDAAHALRAAQRLFLGNAQTRLPFAGVAAFYRALQQGIRPPPLAPGDDHANPTCGGENPIFYVSSSPWNLYDLLSDFMALNGIPPGPLFLRDYGLRPSFGAGGHHSHKLVAIEEILALWPALPIVLIGDSGQQDPEIYTEVVRRHGDRIRAVYIRDVSAQARDRQVVHLAAESARLGVPMVVTAESAAAHAHAAQFGLVRAPE